MRSSLLYREELWRLGLAGTRTLPPFCTEHLAMSTGSLYSLLSPARRQIVYRNLLPAFDGNKQKAWESSGELFRQFGLKLVDLWRVECGEAASRMFRESSGWDYLAAATGRGQGILLLTAHLGNWELGAPLMAERGLKVHVVTQPEPGQNFTHFRTRLRQRWGVETIVVGNDTFSFLEIVRRLDAGGIVALLIDRPVDGTAIEARLFGQSFRISMAPAELARATECLLLPVYLPRGQGGYSAHLLPPIDYDPALLRKVGEKNELGQRILDAFSDPIKQHLDQWFHFSPLWS